jgi:hypothetical protein
VLQEEEENDTSAFEIPIFTEEFLDHNKGNITITLYFNSFVSFTFREIGRAIALTTHFG